MSKSVYEITVSGHDWRNISTLYESQSVILTVVMLIIYKVVYPFYNVRMEKLGDVDE